MTASVIDFLLARKSAPIQELTEPAPSEDEIRTILTAASRVPDHGRLAPWRFILYRGDAREKVGEMLADLAEKREGPLTEGRRQQELARFSRAPLVVGVVHVPRENPKIPQWEMFLSGGMAAFNLMMAANALGYQTNMITNWYSDTEEGRRILGLTPDERVVGFVHIGTFKGDAPERPRPDVETLYGDYAGPWEGQPKVFYEPLKGHGLPHDPFKAIVAPRPIGWISTVSATGALNLAPYSFFNALSTRPYLVWFSSEGVKDSVTFARETGEFVVNLVSSQLAKVMNETAIDAPRGVAEFELAGLTPAASHLVAPPRVAEASAALECKVTEINEPKGLDGRPAGVHVVTGEVVGIHIDEAVMTDGLFDIVKAGNVARLGYMDFTSVSETFAMRRPRWADKS